MSWPERVRTSFFRYGWLLPLVVVGGYSFGRALSYNALGIYIIWALLALRRDDLRLLPRPLVILYGALLVTFGLGIPWAVDAGTAIKVWLKLFALSAALPFTWIVLHRTEDWRPPLIRGATIVSTMVVAAFIGSIVLAGLQHGLDSLSTGHNGMMPACLFPLALGPLIKRQDGARPYWPAATLLTLLFLVALVLKDSRTEVVMALVGLVVLATFHFSKRKVIALSAIAIILMGVVFGLMHRGHNWGNGREGDSAWFQTLDTFSSGRMQLWRGAIENLPNSPWIGVGLRNVANHREVFGALTVQHLHNIFMDVWYDTGHLGLAALLGLLGYLFSRSLSGLHSAGSSEASWFAAAAAAAVTLLLDNSYTSVIFAPFLLFELAILVRFAEERVASQAGGR